MREKWSHLTAAHGQPSAVTENISNDFSPGPFLRLTDGEIHKETKELAPRQSAAKDCTGDSGHISKPPLQAFAIAWKKGVDLPVSVATVS